MTAFTDWGAIEPDDAHTDPDDLDAYVDEEVIEWDETAYESSREDW